MSDSAIFLDRDNTLIEDPGYINHPDLVKLLDGVPEALRELKALGYKLLVVTNQSAVARGIITEKVLNEIHDRLKRLLAEQGAPLDRIYYCPYHPEGVIPKYRKDSDCRKPNPGMFLTAAKEMDINLSKSWCIGNNIRDIEAGLKAGCKTILINSTSYYAKTKPAEPKPHFYAVNMKEAVNIIKKHHRSIGEEQVHTNSVNQTELDRKNTKSTLQAEKQPDKLETVEINKSPQKLEMAKDNVEQLLKTILEQLKSLQRGDMFGEFSIMRLFAGILQILVLFCLLITIWLLLSPSRQNSSVLIALGFAGVFQLMSLTFYIMQGRK